MARKPLLLRCMRGPPVSTLRLNGLNDFPSLATRPRPCPGDFQHLLVGDGRSASK